VTRKKIKNSQKEMKELRETMAMLKRPTIDISPLIALKKKTSEIGRFATT
jgi:hypothetical protein